MTTITIQVREQTETGFSAIARIDQGTDYPIQISHPFTPEQEQDLVWYFEEWNAVAYLQADRLRAERVAVKMRPPARLISKPCKSTLNLTIAMSKQVPTTS